MIKWAVWGALLMIQNASFTWVSRARNSGSVHYHAIASVFSNGVWFAFQIFIIDTIVEALKSKNALLIAFTAAFYITLKRGRER